MVINTSETDQVLKIGTVPVRNLWLLMLYASDLYRETGKTFSSIEDAPDDIPDIIAQMLCLALEKRLRRNLNKAYQTSHKRLNRLRGKIDVLETTRHRLLAKSQIACDFQELTVNTNRNRYIKSALEKLSSLLSTKPIANKCLRLARQLQSLGVIGLKPDNSIMSKETYGRYDVDDRQLVATAKLAFELSLPLEKHGQHFLPAPDKDIIFIRKLFEKATAGFFKVNLEEFGWKVKAGKKLQWKIDSASEGIDKILPSMTTDIELSNPDQHIVIDTKFNNIIVKGWYREQSLRSGYLYQMYAYLRSQEDADLPMSLLTQGVLLHPCVNEPLDEQVTIQGHKIRFLTVDLAGSAKDIKFEFLKVIEK